MIARNALVAWVAIALTSTACQTPAQEVRPLSEEDVAAIRNFFEVHTQNVLASDWAADAALRTEDAVGCRRTGRRSGVARLFKRR